MSGLLALALAAGMVAALNPCAFSLLPAYVGFFVPPRDSNEQLDRTLVRAAGSALLATAGFILVFVLAGSMADLISGSVQRRLPWVSFLAGAAVAGAGVLVIAGRSMRLPQRLSALLFKRQRRQPASMLGYGILYAVVSLSCTIGPFLAITTVAIDRSRPAALGVFAAYAVGMGAVVTMLALAAAFARPRSTRSLRRLSRHAPRAGGLLMVLSGAYTMWYARWQLGVYAGNLSSDPIVERGEELRLRLVETIEGIGPGRIALAVAACLAVAIVAARITVRR